MYLKLNEISLFSFPIVYISSLKLLMHTIGKSNDNEISLNLYIYIYIYPILCSTLFYLCEPGSSVGIAPSRWTVRDRIPMGTRFSERPDRPWGPPSLL